MQLEEFGAPAAPDDPDERRVWLTENIRQLTRPVRHRGNHKYAWPLTTAMRQTLPATLPSATLPTHLWFTKEGLRYAVLVHFCGDDGTEVLPALRRSVRPRNDVDVLFPDSLLSSVLAFRS